ncbi:chorismate mutase [Paenibacillus swuensis]|uniref:chorismate mutase n=1 Tax=Paenibacillus swuensis TaxID=1178515 RepID=A0A172TLX6_9BACL|nr:chorismate mutase [Paenibacillus swuensis]ANE47966.1 chorismate mutase [Paenibacillus swuensis]
MFVRGIRGAITVDSNSEQEILDATTELLSEIVNENEVNPEHICSVFVTMTTDLDATFPARAIRQMEDWDLVPLMCSVEIPVHGSLAKCIRLMVTVNTEKAQRQMVHVYLRGAQILRPDLAPSSQ